MVPIPKDLRHFQDGKSQMTVLLDRAEGGTAHAGNIEIMVMGCQKVAILFLFSVA